MDKTIEGNAFFNNQIQNCRISIKKGIISDIKTNTSKINNQLPEGKIILPAGIDLHVHFRDPGFPEKEDFYHGSQAAIYGGITCACDMPNTKPFTDTLTKIREKNLIAQQKSLIDFGLYAGITKTALKNIKNLTKYAAGFKLFLCSTTESSKCDQNDLPTIFSKISDNKTLLLVHAEDPKYFLPKQSENQNLTSHLQSRPTKAETQAIALILRLHKKYNTKVHICHISSQQALKLLDKRLPNLTIGVTPHHLLLHKDLCIESPGFMKVNPPIRTREDQAFIYRTFLSNKIDVVESDHAPHTKKEKNAAFYKIPSGMPGIETMYPLLLAAVKRGDLLLSDIVNHMCINPGKILGIPKGEIKIGNHADFCIVDFDSIKKISANSLHYRCGWSAFEGWHGIFPSDVFLRGISVLKHGKIVSDKGIGKNIVDFKIT